MKQIVPEFSHAVNRKPCGVRGYTTNGDRKRAIAMLIRKRGPMRFVCYPDVQARFAVMYSSADVTVVLP